MITFQTPGLIDIRAVTTLGVSVKESENPIGFFGTGLKYAIAIILRNEGSITIHRGLERFDFTKKEVIIRDKPVQLVCMNGQELGFTVELGKQWEVWKAFRELECNTLDEGGRTEGGLLPPQADRTSIQVQLAAFDQAFADRHKYFITGSPVECGLHADFYPGPEAGIFYRGIRIADSAGPCPLKFRVNVKSQIILTEDRTCKSMWDIWYHVGRTILHSTNKEFLEDWLTTGKDYYEFQIDLDWSAETPTPEFLEVAARLMKDTSRPLNISVIKVLARYSKAAAPTSVKLFAHEERKVREAVEFCKKLGYEVDEFPFIFVESLGKNILGRALTDSRTILISKQAIDSGDAMLAGTLLEEWVHIKHGFYDCDRDMQNWLFNQVIRLGQAYVEAQHERP